MMQGPYPIGWSIVLGDLQRTIKVLWESLNASQEASQVFAIENDVRA